MTLALYLTILATVAVVTLLVIAFALGGIAVQLTHFFENDPIRRKLLDTPAELAKQSQPRRQQIRSAG